MKNFELESGMTTMGGVFYPTGHMVLMFPSEQAARAAADKLEKDGLETDKISLLTPDDIHGKIAHTVGTADIPLPSAGTESDTVRKFAELASQGHYALLIHSPHGEETAHIMEVLAGSGVSYAQKYRHLVIEDLDSAAA